MSNLASRPLTNEDKIQYAEPLDIVQLFTQRRIEFTFNHIASRFIELVEKNADNVDFIYPIIYSDHYDNFIFEYTFLIKILSEFVDNERQFLSDFRKDNPNEQQKKNIEFLIVSVLEDLLGCIRLNNRTMSCDKRKSITYRPSFYKSTIIKFIHPLDGNEHFNQIDGVFFPSNSFSFLIDEALFSELKSITKNSSFKHLYSVYGANACKDFWKKINGN